MIDYPSRIDLAVNDDPTDDFERGGDHGVWLDGAAVSEQDLGGREQLHRRHGLDQTPSFI
jgi:hypothetical protein